MKKFVFASIRFLLVLVVFMFFILPADAATLIDIPEKKGILEFIKLNWSQIALVISEAAALAPGKVKGIVQGILSIIPMLFASKANRK